MNSRCQRPTRHGAPALPEGCARLTADEAEAFGVVKPFHRSLSKGMHYAYIFVQGGAPMMVVDRLAIGSLICAFAMPLSEIKAKLRFRRMLDPWITSRHTSPACGRK